MKCLTVIKVGLMYGGKSGEHEVSCRSGEGVRKYLADKNYQVLDIKLDRNNHFDSELLKKAEVVFPVVHGTYGEDGCLQGMLEMLDKPYVGAGVLGSALGMDKEVQKRLLGQRKIPVARYVGLNRMSFDYLAVKGIRFPVFVKPAAMGSSVGIMRVEREAEMGKAIENAFQYDTKILIEEAVAGREIEVAVLGDETAGFPVEASVPGEVIPTGGHKFYDYEAKYIDENGAVLQIPAKNLNAGEIKRIQNLAIKTFAALECSGMARVDMFLKPGGRLVVNEINTLPGFTNISMYPKLWEASGLAGPDVVDRLVRMAIERRKIKSGLCRSYNHVSGGTD